MALSVLLKRSQDVLRRYVEDERLSGRCPLPRYNPARTGFKAKVQLFSLKIVFLLRLMQIAFLKIVHTLLKHIKR